MCFDDNNLRKKQLQIEANVSEGVCINLFIYCRPKDPRKTNVRDVSLNTFFYQKRLNTFAFILISRANSETFCLEMSNCKSSI